jgi:hypothetical protein
MNNFPNVPTFIARIEALEAIDEQRIATIVRLRNGLALAEEIAHRAIKDRDSARAIAALLEEECSSCWGPVHSQVINGLVLARAMALQDEEAAENGT